MFDFHWVSTCLAQSIFCVTILCVGWGGGPEIGYFRWACLRESIFHHRFIIGSHENSVWGGGRGGLITILKK